jgi:NAD(P)-dependent dehydrogenase (short-subunit alcohol dehydrogenase family)
MKDLFSVAGKVVLVTGGTRGIGLMIARGFVENGAKVYVSSRKKETCDEAAAELSKLGTCISLPADVSTEAEANRLAAEIGSREPALHVLVNNAGANWGAPLAEYPDAAWDKVLALNVKGVFHLTRALVPLLEKGVRPGDPARVINIGSIDGLRVPLLETYAYSASKAAVHHLTKTLAARLAPNRITVNAVAPGPFESKMMAATLDAFRDAIVASCPLGRIGEPEDMAGVAIYLASRAGAYVTGTVIPVDGGICIKGA